MRRALFLLPLLAAAPAAAQRTASVRAEVRVPRILQLNVEPGVDVQSSPALDGAGTEEARLRVRANVPWQLVARAEGSEGGGIRIDVVDASGAGVAGSGGMVGEESGEGGEVEVARSAGRGDAVVTVRLSWPAAEGDRPRPLYVLTELD